MSVRGREKARVKQKKSFRTKLKSQKKASTRVHTTVMFSRTPLKQVESTPLSMRIVYVVLRSVIVVQESCKCIVIENRRGKSKNRIQIFFFLYFQTINGFFDLLSSNHRRNVLTPFTLLQPSLSFASVIIIFFFGEAPNNIFLCVCVVTKDYEPYEITLKIGLKPFKYPYTRIMAVRTDVRVSFSALGGR